MDKITEIIDARTAKKTRRQKKSAEKICVQIEACLAADQVAFDATIKEFQPTSNRVMAGFARDMQILNQASKRA